MANPLNGIEKHADIVQAILAVCDVTAVVRFGCTRKAAQELVFEARLNQNLDFKATFPMVKIMPTVSAEKVEDAEPASGK